MKSLFFAATAILLVVVFAVTACNENEHGNLQVAGSRQLPLTRDSLVNRGAYLVTIMGCNDCHTPKIMGPRGPEPDRQRLFCGHPADMPLPDIDPADLSSWVLFSMGQTAVAGPWGVSFAANISSDSTGIGTWSEQQFARAMRQGKYKGLENGRELLPPMPWPSYAHLTDEDLRAIFYYLKATRPVRNIVPAPIPPDRLAAR